MNKYNKIIKHYGASRQIEKAMEELKELYDELYKYGENQDKDKVFDEFCDVMNVMVHLQIIFNWHSDDISKRMDEKLERQLKRMEEVNNTKII